MAIRVLIVDDTDSMRDLMRAHMTDCQMDVVGEAGDGRAAVEIARTTQPDAVILDVEMPVMDGLEALPHLVTVAPDAKVIVFSSRADAATAAASGSPGVAGVFYKGQHSSRDVVAFLRGLFPCAHD